MIKRTLLIESPSHLNVENDLLKVTNKTSKKSETFVFDELGFIVIENYQSTTTAQFFQKTAENNVVIIFCDKKHTPISYSIPLYFNKTQTQTLNNQISISQEIKHNLWKQLIKGKVTNQAALLKLLNKNYLEVQRLSQKITLENVNSIESTASRFYWKSVFDLKKFTRNSEGEPPNQLLNYGYSILRGATARALIGSGLLPQIAIHHHNKYDSLPLADDVMEPYRPFIDEVVANIVKEDDYHLLHRRNKEKLLRVLACDCKIGNVKRPLMIALTYTTASISNVINKKSNRIVLPELIIENEISKT